MRPPLTSITNTPRVGWATTKSASPSCAPLHGSARQPGHAVKDGASFGKPSRSTSYSLRSAWLFVASRMRQGTCEQSVVPCRAINGYRSWSLKASGTAFSDHDCCTTAARKSRVTPQTQLVVAPLIVKVAQTFVAAGFHAALTSTHDPVPGGMEDGGRRVGNPTHMASPTGRVRTRR